MKLEKREITLNESDSLKDVFYLERTILLEYESGKAYAFRKETVNELQSLVQDAKKDTEKTFSLWQKSAKERV